MEPNLHTAGVGLATATARPSVGPAPAPGLTQVGPEGRPPGSSNSTRWVLEWLAVLVVALLLALGVRTFVAQMFFIPSGSMLPTLQIGERIVVDKLSYHLHGVHRGDIVVFRKPPLEQADYSDLVKRVIGLPGETISAVGGRVYIDGRPLAEPWLPQPMPVTAPSPLPEGFSLNHPYIIPAGEYYVMGDNRTDSEDSRYFGPIPGNLIVGKMVLEVWPIGSELWLLGLSLIAGLLVVMIAATLWDIRSLKRSMVAPSRGPPHAVTYG